MFEINQNPNIATCNYIWRYVFMCLIFYFIKFKIILNFLDSICHLKMQRYYPTGLIDNILTEELSHLPLRLPTYNRGESHRRRPRYAVGHIMRISLSRYLCKLAILLHASVCAHSPLSLRRTWQLAVSVKQRSAKLSLREMIRKTVSLVLSSLTIREKRGYRYTA